MSYYNGTILEYSSSRRKRFFMSERCWWWCCWCCGRRRCYRVGMVFQVNSGGNNDDNDGNEKNAFLASNICKKLITFLKRSLFILAPEQILRKYSNRCKREWIHIAYAGMHTCIYTIFSMIERRRGRETKRDINSVGRSRHERDTKENVRNLCASACYVESERRKQNDSLIICHFHTIRRCWRLLL